MADERLDAAKAALLERVLSDMERDGTGWVKQWSFASLPMNGERGYPYRGRNALLLWMRMRQLGTDDPRFVTLRTALRLGCPVRKGEHATPVEKWGTFARRRDDPEAAWRRVKAEELEEIEGDPDQELKRRVIGRWDLFNASQLTEPEGKLTPLYEPRRNGASRLADDLISASPCPVSERPRGHAFYDITRDSITVPLREQFKSTESFCRTLIHEQCHATGTRRRIGREYFDLEALASADPERHKEMYALEELVAELGCVFTAAQIGLDLSAASHDEAASEGVAFSNSVAYLRSWAARAGHEKAADALLAQSSKASAACDWLVEKCYKPALGAELFARDIELEREPVVERDVATTRDER